MIISGSFTSGSDEVIYDGENDLISLPPGTLTFADTVRGGDGNDTLEGTLFRGNILFGEGGDDELQFSLTSQITLASTLDGGDGNDFLSVTGRFLTQVGLSDYVAQGATLIGGSGSDTLKGSGGSDSLSGGDGDDIIDPGSGSGFLPLLRNGRGSATLRISDNVDGGDGSDTLFVSSFGVQATGLTNVQRNGSVVSTFDGFGGTIERSSSYSGTIFGTTAVDGVRGFSSIVYTGIEQLSLVGSSYKDSLTGTNGNDTLDGGLGNDTFNGGYGADIIIGGDGADSILGGDGNDTLDGGLGDDFIDGGSGAGADSILGGDGNDKLIGGVDNDTLSGGNGADSLRGDTGDDRLSGNNDNDTLSGGDGNDTLNGGNGLDILAGGADNDFLIGGAESDVFRFGATTLTFDQIGIDRISDFVVADGDRIQLSRTTFASLTVLGSQLGTDFGVVSSYSAAAKSTAVIVYNSTNGRLYYNTNGSDSGFGTGGQFATLTGLPSLSSTDFRIIT